MKTVLVPGAPWPDKPQAPQSEVDTRLLTTYLLTLENPQRNLDIAEAIGCHRKTAHRLLLSLRECELIRDSGFKAEGANAAAIWWEAV